MARYIDADKLWRKLPNDLPYKATVKRVLIQAPAADVVEVKHGYWKHKTTYGQLEACNCSLCGQLMTTIEGKRMNYCCGCGAKMDGGKAE